MNTLNSSSTQTKGMWKSCLRWAAALVYMPLQSVFVTSWYGPDPRHFLSQQLHSSICQLMHERLSSLWKPEPRRVTIPTGWLTLMMRLFWWDYCLNVVIYLSSWLILTYSQCPCPSAPFECTHQLTIQLYDRTSIINPCLDSSVRFVEKLVGEVKQMHVDAGLPLDSYHFGGVSDASFRLFIALSSRLGR